MKNLLKNVVRSFKNNKISIIGLVFLLFFGLGVFATMSNTTSNIRNEYTSLAERGKLHDFTASELYDVGSAVYIPDTKGISYDVAHDGETPIYSNWLNFNFLDPASPKHISTSDLYAGNALATLNDGTYYVPVPEQKIFWGDTADTVIRTYNLILDADSSSGLYKDFAINHPNSEYVKFIFKVIKTYQHDFFGETTVPQKVRDNQIILDKWNQPSTITTAEVQTLATSSLFSDDYQAFAKYLTEHTQNVFSIMTTTDTPLTNKIHKDYKNEVDCRFFKSINVTATEDKIYYKIIDSNPSDTIDTMVLFSDPSGRTGNQLFSTNDWQPYDSEIVIYDLDHNPIEPGTSYELPTKETIVIPENFNEVVQVPLVDPSTIFSREGYTSPWQNPEAREMKWIYSQILHIRFKRMLAGDRSTTGLDECLFNVAAQNLDIGQYTVQFFTKSSNIFKAYQEYYTDWYGGAGESITISSNGNVVFTWIEALGTPQTCTISNWTSRFSIVNPQHLEKNNKRVLSPSVLNDFAPFKEWYKVNYNYYPSGEIRQDVAIKWFNSLTQNQLNFWINPNTKSSWTSMSYDIHGLENPIVVKRGTRNGEWNGIDKQYIAACGGYNQIIWGCGLTPDFMYPVVDITRPTPNTATECLVYCNDAGYQTIKLAFVNSTVEEYLLARFKANVNTNRRQEIVNEINTWAIDNMIFPDNVKCAYFANDTSNLLNCSGFRVSYIPNLVNVIQIVTTILCSFIGILCLVICFVIIKRYVENNRVNIGIMRANGIKKWKIGVSMLPFAFFPALVGGIAAYLTGLFLQAPALSLFKNYWMLPTPLIKFNWISFLSSIFVPFLIFGLICFIATLLVLRVNSVELMKSGSEFKTNSFSRIAKKPFKHFGILTRFRVALAFNSISRLLMMAAMSCLTMSSLVFAFTTFDKLNTSRVTNSTQFDYNFNVQLTTPTSSGSIYSVYDYSAPTGENTIRGLGWSDPSQYSFATQWDTNRRYSDPNPEWGTTEGVDYYSQLTKWYSLHSMEALLDTDYFNIVGKNGNLMLPTMNDATGQDIDLMYLQNKLCSRLTLDYNIGVPGLAASNPWEIALALMPANSRNIAADSFNTIINKVGHYVKDSYDQFITDENLVALKNAGQLLSNGSIYANDGLVPTTYSITQTEQMLNEAKDRSGNKWVKLNREAAGILDPNGMYWRNSYLPFFIYNAETDTYSLDTYIGTVGHLFGSFNSPFLSLIKTIYTDKELVELEYPITYGNVPLNWDKKDGEKLDETYTYITANLRSLSNDHSFDPTEEITIEGIVEESQYIKLTDKKGNDLNSWLFSENYLNSLGIDDVVHPMVINAYAAHKYKLDVGDQIVINATNTVDRYEQKLHSENYDDTANEAKFKIVGVSQGTNNAAFYTTQTIANDVLGLPNGKSWNKTHKFMMRSVDGQEVGQEHWGTSPSDLPEVIDLGGVGSSSGYTTVYSFTNNAKTEFVNTPNIITNTVPKLSGLKPPVGFNGIYTENTSGKPITAGLSLYSYTGMYPGSSVYKSNGNNKFAEILSYGANLAIANLMSGVQDPEIYQVTAAHLANPSDPTILSKFNEKIVWLIDKLSDVYGDTTMVTAICGALDVAASDLIYNNLISTFNLAETTIMAIVIPITIIIVAIISNLIINDSKKMSAMLKALGYSDAKNLMSILALFVPTIILGLGLAVPLSFGLTLGYQSIIFSSANILIDVTQKWWYYVAAVGGIGIILVGTYAIGYVSIKRSRLVDEIK